MAAVQGQAFVAGQHRQPAAIQNPLQDVKPNAYIKEVFARIGTVHSQESLDQVVIAINGITREHLVEAQKDRHWYNFALTESGKDEYALRQITHMMTNIEPTNTTPRQKRAYTELRLKLNTLYRQLEKRGNDVDPALKAKFKTFRVDVRQQMDVLRDLSALPTETGPLGVQNDQGQFPRVARMSYNELEQAEQKLGEYKRKFDQFFSQEDMKDVYEREHGSLEETLTAAKNQIQARKAEIERTTKGFRTRLKNFGAAARNADRSNQVAVRNLTGLAEGIKADARLIDLTSFGIDDIDHFDGIIDQLTVNGRLPRTNGKEELFTLDGLYDRPLAIGDIVAGVTASAVAAGIDTVVVDCVGFGLGMWAIPTAAVVGVLALGGYNYLRGGKVAEWF